ncbi:MAG: Rnase Y domain-containing protein, partial [Syntrophomonas sp.]
MKEIDTIQVLILVVSALLAGLAGGYFIRKSIAERKLGTAEQEAARTIEEATKEAEAKKKELLLEAKDEIHQNRQEVEKDLRERRRDLDRMERRVLQKEELVDKKTDNIEKKEQNLQEKEKEIDKTQQDIQMILTRQLKELERLSGLTTEGAKELLLYNVEQQIRQETAVMIRTLENEAKEESDKRARNIVSLAIQRCAADVVSETTV